MNWRHTKEPFATHQICSLKSRCNSHHYEHFTPTSCTATWSAVVILLFVPSFSPITHYKGNQLTSDYRWLNCWYPRVTEIAQWCFNPTFLGPTTRASVVVIQHTSQLLCHHLVFHWSWKNSAAPDLISPPGVPLPPLPAPTGSPDEWSNDLFSFQLSFLKEGWKGECSDTFQYLIKCCFVTRAFWSPSVHHN